MVLNHNVVELIHGSPLSKKNILVAQSMNANINSDEELFDNFYELIKAHFSFLSDYDYKINKKKLPFVECKSPKATLLIYYDSRSYALEVYLSQNYSFPATEFSLGTILEYLLGPNHMELSEPQGKSLEDAFSFIPGLADLVNRHLTELLKGSKNEFKKIKKFAAQKEEQEHLERVLKEKRNEANEAWKQHRYSETLRIYDSIKPYLTKSEIKKLEFCKKKK